MSKKNRKPTGFYGDNYWQSAEWNQRSFRAYRDWICALAINRYKWINLPETCDERFLEFTLMRQGVATIAYPKNMPMQFFSTQVNMDGRWNVYDTPSHWQSIGNNGWRFNASPQTGVLVYDNRLRMPYYNQVEFFARRLAAIDRVEDINMRQQATPYLITAPRESINDAKQMYKQIAGGEPAIIGKPTLSNIDIQALNTQVPYLGKELSEKKLALWDEIYNFLGISHVGQKSERLTSEEVAASNEPSNLMALDGLNSRRDACKKLNERFGTDIHVVWRKDNESDMYNYTRNPYMNESLMLNDAEADAKDNSADMRGSEGTHE